MKKVVSILFLVTMLLQAIPVLHFFTEKPEIFYTSIDEEKPSEKGKETKEDKQGDKAFLSFCTPVSVKVVEAICFQNYTSLLPPSPHLEMLTPPPDFC
ncbi:MAG TPA: hypothetical protein VM871_12290 [Flavisolibacter sp.]|jgi:hypothetical protein|nr:hypothetical protein [Flavisolibacter sp.]